MRENVSFGGEPQLSAFNAGSEHRRLRLAVKRFVLVVLLFVSHVSMGFAEDVSSATRELVTRFCADCHGSPDDGPERGFAIGEYLASKPVDESGPVWEKAVDRYAEGGFYNPAIALCNKILRASPGRTVIYYKLGKIHAEKGFRGDARQNFLEYASRQQKAGKLDEAFRALKEFADLVPDQELLFELHINAQHRLSGRPAYAYCYEDPLIRPVNGDRKHLLKYRKVFTSNEDLVDGDRFIKLDYPNDLTMVSTAPWGERPMCCVLIAGNKALARPNPRNLHHRRVAIARAFEQHAPELFALYGRGWGQPAVRSGVTGRLLKRLREWQAKLHKTAPAFPSWRGTVHAKAEVLTRARFAIAYENVQGSPGYITEKIFDCFVHGCVPVYLGTPGAAASIPALKFRSSVSTSKLTGSGTPIAYASWTSAWFAQPRETTCRARNRAM